MLGAPSGFYWSHRRANAKAMAQLRSMSKSTPVGRRHPARPALATEHGRSRGAGAQRRAPSQQPPAPPSRAGAAATSSTPTQQQLQGQFGQEQNASGGPSNGSPGQQQITLDGSEQVYAQMPRTEIDGADEQAYAQMLSHTGSDGSDGVRPWLGGGAVLVPNPAFEASLVVSESGYAVVGKGPRPPVADAESGPRCHGAPWPPAAQQEPRPHPPPLLPPSATGCGAPLTVPPDDYSPIDTTAQQTYHSAVAAPYSDPLGPRLMYAGAEHGPDDESGLDVNV